MQSKHSSLYHCKTCGEKFVSRQGKNRHNNKKHMTFIIPGDLSDELDYKSLETNVKFIPQKCKKVITESEKLARNEKLNNRRREKRRKADEEVLFVAFK